MKVKELITLLQDVDPDLDICLDREDTLDGNYVPVKSIVLRELNGHKFVTLEDV